MNELQGIQKLFTKIEGLIGDIGYYGGKYLDYKECLKARLGIDSTAFEVLYFDELEEYLENPQDFHLYYDDSRVDWIEVWEQLNKIESELV